MTPTTEILLPSDALPPRPLLVLPTHLLHTSFLMRPSIMNGCCAGSSSHMSPARMLQRLQRHCLWVKREQSTGWCVQGRLEHRARRTSGRNGRLAYPFHASSWRARWNGPLLHDPCPFPPSFPDHQRLLRCTDQSNHHIGLYPAVEENFAAVGAADILVDGHIR